jgi:hypothetical protein
MFRVEVHLNVYCLVLYDGSPLYSTIFKVENPRECVLSGRMGVQLGGVWPDRGHDGGLPGVPTGPGQGGVRLQ